MGATEALSENAASILKFDDFVFRRYRRGEIEFDIYLAHWGPGKMPVNVVNMHNPDGCWPMVGWRLDRTGPDGDFVVGESTLRGASVRSFRSEAGIRYVAFWHLVDGDAYANRYESIQASLRWWWFSGAAIEFGPGPEQYFIRISSNRQFGILREQSGFRDAFAQLVENFSRLRLFSGAVARDVRSPNN